MDKETKLRSVLFFAIGFLLVLSLIICIYIIAGERDLVPVEGIVTNVTKDSGKIGVNNVAVKYTVDGKELTFSLTTKKDYKSGDKINVYYHANDKDKVKYYKTSKMIFLCPIIGLILCGLGLFELFKKNNDIEDFKTDVIGVIGNTEQLKIVTDDTKTEEYVPTPEEQKEVQVKQLNQIVAQTGVETVVSGQPEAEETPAVEEEVAPAQVEQVVAEPVAEPIPEPAVAEVEPVPEEVAPVETPQEVQEVVEEAPAEVVEEVKEEPKPEMVSVDEAANKSLEENIAKKVKEKRGDKIEVTEDELKEAIKDVLADVIKEAKQESEKPKEVVQVRVIPNYYYISGTSLMYEEAGKERKELSLKNIKGVTRTINSEGNVVKLTVESDEVKCILTNMKNIDLEQLSNLLRNKLRAMDENFEEVIEHKEY